MKRRHAAVPAAAMDPQRESEIRKEAARSVHESYQPIISALVEEAENLGATMATAARTVIEAADRLAVAIDVAKSALQFHEIITEPRRATKPAAKLPPQLTAGAIARRQELRQDPGAKIEFGLRHILIALAQHYQGLSARQIGVRIGMSSTSDTFATHLGKGRSYGWIEGSRDLLRLTSEGGQALGSYDPLPSGKALLDYWLDQLVGGAARILAELAKAYPKSLDAEELGRRAELSASSGTFRTYLGKLRILELVDGPRASLTATKEFFE